MQGEPSQPPAAVPATLAKAPDRSEAILDIPASVDLSAEDSCMSEPSQCYA